MAEDGPVLTYEHRPEPPCLLREPGRVALLTPPPPRWVVTACAVLVAAVWAMSVGMAAWVIPELAQRGLLSRTVFPAALFYGVAPLVLTGVMVGNVVWWARTSRQPFVIEVAGGALVFTTPGMWRHRVWRTPLARVKDVSFDEDRVLGRGRWVRVKVRVRLIGTHVAPRRSFYTVDGALAGEARRAFAEALGRTPDEK